MTSHNSLLDAAFFRGWRVIEVSSHPVSIHCSLRVSLNIFFSDLKCSSAHHFEKNMAVAFQESVVDFSKIQSSLHTVLFVRFLVHIHPLWGLRWYYFFGTPKDQWFVQKYCGIALAEEIGQGERERTRLEWQVPIKDWLWFRSVSTMYRSFPWWNGKTSITANS